ncbi:MAG: FkbM family methyltransferase [Deltaproteobacteria bacterium]|nr:FkbM family methyltransferase [Deltaproteobacteria bacterium]
MISNKLLFKSVNLVPWHFRALIKRLPIVAHLQRYLFNKFLSGKDFIYEINAGPAKGLKYPVSLPKDKLIWMGTYEAELANIASKSVTQNAICYDIGGYRGFFSGVFAIAGAKSVYVFEPFPENFEQIKHLIELNPNLPIKVKQMAIGNKNTITKFNVMPDESMGKLVNSTFQKDRKANRVINVSLKKIDSLIRDDGFPTPDIIKIDVEGAEVNVLRGAQEALRLKHPQLFIEAHSKKLCMDCSSILKSLDYQVTILETGLAPSGNNVPEISHLLCR